MRNAAVILAACLAGCANNREKSVVVKTTVLGIDASTGMPNTPGLRLGLVRSLYVTVPAGQALTSDVDATVTPTKDTVREKFTFGPPSSEAFSVTNTVNVRRK